MPGVESALKSNISSETPTTWRCTFKPTGDGCAVKVTWDVPLLGLPGIEEKMPGRDAGLEERGHLAGQPQAAGRGLTGGATDLAGQLPLRP